MLWAIGAILLHVQMVPQAVVANKALLAETVPDSNDAAPTAFEPGRLLLTPATPAGVEPSAAAPALPAPAPIAPVIAVSRNTKAAGRITGGPQKAWLGLAIAQHSAAAFDAWSTRRAITQGGAQELNPLLKPFAGNRSIYAATQVAPTLLDLLGRRMMTSRHGLLRRTWWLPQALGTAASLAASANNLRVH